MEQSQFDTMNWVELQLKMDELMNPRMVVMLCHAKGLHDFETWACPERGEPKIATSIRILYI